MTSPGSGTRARRLWIGALAIGAAVGIGAALGGETAKADAASTQTATSVSAVAIEALTTASADEARTRIPADFAERFGYVPIIDNDVLINPDGDCSSPVPLPSEFDTSCKVHDLGYDLLRYGSAVGSPVPVSARKALDADLGRDMHNACRSRSGIGSRSSCHVMADIAAAAVEFNSLRQHYGAPDPEPALPLLLTAGLGTAVLATASALRTVVSAR